MFSLPCQNTVLSHFHYVCCAVDIGISGLYHNSCNNSKSNSFHDYIGLKGKSLER